MEIDSPRQRTTDQRWDYTRQSGGIIRPIGYCQPWDEATAHAVTDPQLQAMISAWLDEARPFKNKYHETGHATPEEAQACYRRYLLDQRVKWRQSPTVQRKCLAPDCGVWTTGYAEIEEQIMPLCDDHRHQDMVEFVFQPYATPESPTA